RAAISTKPYAGDDSTRPLPLTTRMTTSIGRMAIRVQVCVTPVLVESLDGSPNSSNILWLSCSTVCGDGGYDSAPTRCGCRMVAQCFVPMAPGGGAEWQTLVQHHRLPAGVPGPHHLRTRRHSRRRIRQPRRRRVEDD